MIGYLKIYRKLLNWECYNDLNVRVTFIHLLLIASWKDKNWKGIEIKRGQAIIGIKKTSEEIGITNQQLRTALNKLEITNEIKCKTTNKYTLVTLMLYEKYQEVENKITNKQQTNNKQITNKKPKTQQTNNKQITNKKTATSHINTGNKPIKETKVTNKQHAIQQTNNKQNNVNVTTSKEVKKIRSKEINNIEYRYADFKKSLKPFLKIYAEVVLIKFFNYWTETNPGGKKMRFEYAKNKPFDISKRLKRWNENAEKWKKEKSSLQKEKTTGAQAFKDLISK